MTKRKDPKDFKKNGRPTKYRPELCLDLIRFFDIDAIIYKDMTITRPDGTTYDKTVAEGSELPFFSAWCRKVEISVETMMTWTEQHPEFLDAYKHSKHLQAEILAKCALGGHYNASFAIFTAKNILGWRDKQEIEHTGEIEGLGHTNITVIKNYAGAKPDVKASQEGSAESAVGRTIRADA